MHNQKNCKKVKKKKKCECYFVGVFYWQKQKQFNHELCQTGFMTAGWKKFDKFFTFFDVLLFSDLEWY